MAFRLSESPIFGVRKAKIRPRWRYVGAKLAYVEPGLDLCRIMLAHDGPMLLYVGPSWGHVGLVLAYEG